MPKQIADLTPAQLFQSLLLLEQTAAEGVYDAEADLEVARKHERVVRLIAELVEDEILRRFELDSTDGLSTLITAAHMSTSEAIHWAGENPDQVLEALKTGDVQAMHVQ